ncbi:MAG: Xaa-Pro peptidase family protein [Saccharofermentanales bacterium]
MIPVQGPDKSELHNRITKFIAEMDTAFSAWESAVIFGKVNQYFFTGTMQDGFLLIKSNGDVFYFVRRSFDRALIESTLGTIYEIESYRDAVRIIGNSLGVTLADTESATYALISRFRKYFNCTSFDSMDRIIFKVRSVKSPYELSLMENSGRLHEKLLTEVAPAHLKEGISEADFVASLFKEMISMGYHGVSRFSMFDTNMVIGQVGFGESSVYPTSFDGPGGNRGLCPAVPTMGSRDRLLRKGDLVFIDIGFGYEGYHTDKTALYIYKADPPEEALRAHDICIKAESDAAMMLKPGAIPADIYDTIHRGLDDDFRNGFMGYGKRTVKFLGHGVGLHIDEYPVIAGGFREPLQEGMTIALEPKKGIEGFGMVGVEDTYVVTPEGGRCLTGGGRKITRI